jgi:transcription initiation factor TFIIIB Brf1 subunit/transcription initiation factor TFIIB
MDTEFEANQSNFIDIDDDDLWTMLDNFAAKKHESASNEEKTHNASKNVCRLCNSTNIVMNIMKSVNVCTDCGCESGEVYECRPEWSNFEEGNHETARCGVATNPFFPKSSTCLVIGGTGCHKLKMLQSWDQVPYKERSLSEVLSGIEAKLKKYKITKAIIDNAKILYKNLSEIKHVDGSNVGKTIIIRGLNRRGLIAACAFYGAKLQGSPRSTKEIADIFDLEEKQVTKGCRRFLELLNYESVYKFHASKACDYVTINSLKLNLFKPDIDLALQITNNINKLDIASDHQPTSVAAGSILLVSDIKDLKISKGKISEIFQISEVTISKTYKKILPYKKFLINNDLTDMMVKRMKEKISENPNIVFHRNNDSRNIFIMPDEISETSSVQSNSESIQSITNVACININESSVSITSKRPRGRPRKDTTISSVQKYKVLE